MGLLDSILLAPIKGVCFIGRKIHEMAMEELLDEEKVREELKALYVLFETGKISMKEFERREEELVDLVEEIMAYKESRNA